MKEENGLMLSEARRFITESMKDWKRPCSECEHYKSGGCTKWECVKEKERIDNALAEAKKLKNAGAAA